MRKRNTNNDASIPSWRVPLGLPKYTYWHTIHWILSIYLDCLELFPNKEFEHAQFTSLKNRKKHSGNQCDGVKLAEYLIIAWLQSSPNVHHSFHVLEELKVRGNSR